MKKLLIITSVALGLSLIVVGALLLRNGKVVGIQTDVTAYPATIGTPGVPATLSTSTESTAVVRNSKGLPNFAFGGKYTPKNYGSCFYLKLERSFDDGTTWFPYMTVTPSTGDIAMNASSTNKTAGTPFVLANACGVSASGTEIAFSQDLTVAADLIRVSAKEYATGTSPLTLGTLELQTYFTSN